MSEPSEWNRAVEACHQIIVDMAIGLDDSHDYFLPEDALEDCAKEVWKLIKTKPCK